MSNDIRTTGSKPLGIKGTIAGVIMNIIHSGQYKKIISRILDDYGTDKKLKVLDIGCGGGGAVKLFCDNTQDSMIYGIDHSPQMSALAVRVNKPNIKNANASIMQGDVENLTFSENTFDIVTAFDTINFWADFEKAMSEICRVIKHGGMFLIVNGYPKENTKWWDFVKFKNEDEYKKMLIGYGFDTIKSEIRKNTIIIQAYIK